MSQVGASPMVVGQDGHVKRNSDEISSDSGDSTPQSPVFKKPCIRVSKSVPSSPTRITRSHSAHPPSTIVAISKEELMARQLKRKAKTEVTVESLSEQIAGLIKSMDDFKSAVKKDNQKNTEELKKSIKDIAGVVPRVTALETTVKKLDKDVSNTKTGLKTRVTALESEVKTLKSYDKSVKKAQDGIRGIEPHLQNVEKFVKLSKESSAKGQVATTSSSTVSASSVSQLETELSQLGTACSTKFDIVTGWMEKFHWQQQSLQSQVEFNMSKNM